jgi:archaemetzincin
MWRILIILLIVGCSGNPFTKRDKKIGILPLEKFPNERLSSITTAIKDEYGFDVSILPSQEIPERFFVNVKSPRYRADSIINYVRRMKADSIDIVLALTDHDISMTKRDPNGEIKKPESKYIDWGVFGLGYLPGESCIVSTFRIQGKKSFEQRLKKICLHEVGHNLGLPHCSDPACLMVDAAESISTVDKAGDHLCANCRKKISL